MRPPHPITVVILAIIVAIAFMLSAGYEAQTEHAVEVLESLGSIEITNDSVFYLSDDASFSPTELRWFGTLQRKGFVIVAGVNY